MFGLDFYLFIYLFQLGSWELIVRFSEEHNLHFKELGSTCVNQPYAATVGPLIIVMCARRWLQPHCTRTQLKVHGKTWRNLTLARVDRFIAACEITRSWEVTQKCPVDALKKINESFHVEKLRLFHHEPFTLGRRGTCLVQLGFFRDFFFFPGKWLCRCRRSALYLTLLDTWNTLSCSDISIHLF